MTAFIPPMTKGPSKFLRMSDIKNMPNRSVSFVFITAPINGDEKWSHEGRPYRIRSGAKFPEGVEWRKEKGKEVEERVKEFRAAGVFNLDIQEVQVFSWTQRKLNERLAAKLARRKDPMAAVVTIIALDVTPADYDVEVEPFDGFTPAQRAKVDAVLGSWVGPVALFDNGDPFESFDKAPHF